MDKFYNPIIENYVANYVQRYNNQLRQLLSFPLPTSLYAQPIRTITIYNALDGLLILYLPGKINNNNQVIHHKDASDLPLDKLLPSLSANLIKVQPPPAGWINPDLSNIQQLIQIPEDIPLNQILKKFLPTLNRELLGQLIYSDKSEHHFTGMAVTPVWKIERSKVTEVVPNRLHIFTPLTPIPDGRWFTQYQWLFADIFWYPEKLPEDFLNGALFAENEINTLKMGTYFNLLNQSFFQNPTKTVVQKAFEVCRLFEDILNDPNTDERAVQEFLEDPAHMFIVSQVNQEIFPRRSIGNGKYIPDFIVLKPDNDYHFIEIENPQKEIYQSNTGEQAAHLTHAISQVQDWLRYVEDNRDTVRREDDLKSIYKPTGEVVAGRTAHLSEIGNRRFNYSRNEFRNITIKTYDILLAEARAYVNKLEELGNKI
jgi:hypothetical protein